MNEIVSEALKAYGMENAEYEIIRHNENITCKVAFDGKAYVLRVHKPIEGFSTKLITVEKSDAALMRSEAKLLQHMQQNSLSWHVGYIKLRKVFQRKE